MKRILLLPAIGLLALSLAGCTATSAASPSSGKSSTPAPAVSATASSAPAPSASNVYKISSNQKNKDKQEATEDLTKLPSSPKQYLSKDALSTLSSSGTDASTVFPSGTKILPQPDTWNETSDTTGLMDSFLVSPTGDKTEYIAMMVKENNVWKLLRTVSPSK